MTPKERRQLIEFLKIVLAKADELIKDISRLDTTNKLDLSSKLSLIGKSSHIAGYLEGAILTHETLEKSKEERKI